MSTKLYERFVSQLELKGYAKRSIDSYVKSVRLPVGSAQIQKRTASRGKLHQRTEQKRVAKARNRHQN